MHVLELPSSNPAVIELLKAPGVECPGCGHGLTGVNAPVCPECGRALRVRLEVRAERVPLLVWIVLAWTALAASMRLAMFVYLMVRSRSAASWTFYSPYGVLSGNTPVSGGPSPRWLDRLSMVLDGDPMVLAAPLWAFILLGVASLWAVVLWRAERRGRVDEWLRITRWVCAFLLCGVLAGETAYWFKYL